MNATLEKLCHYHHVQLCDTLADAVLDALHIPASDSGDYKHVSPEDCSVCANAAAVDEAIAALKVKAALALAKGEVRT